MALAYMLNLEDKKVQNNIFRGRTMYILTFLALYTFASVTLGGKTTPCEDNWVAFNGSCYLFGHDVLHFSEAQRQCEHHNAYLVHVGDSMESAFLTSFINDLIAGEYWIGLTDDVIENIWKWYDTDTIATFFNWNPGEPNQGKTANCVAIRKGYNTRWVDDPCTRSYRALCEKRPHVETEIIG